MVSIALTVSGAGGFNGSGTNVRNVNGVWKLMSGSHVIANFKTQAEADKAAIERCKKAGGRGCKVVSTFYNGGCGYVSVGQKTRGVCWGTAANPQEAQRQCESRGCDCDKAIGNCTTRPGS